MKPDSTFMPFRIARSGDGKHLKEVYSCLMKTIINCIIGFAVALLAPQIVQAQGTMTYLSNLDQASAGSLAVGSNSWVALGFSAGTNASGYVLNSVQLAMTDASGNPSGFTVFLYLAAPGFGPGWIPLGKIGTFSGSLNPATGDIYTFTSVSNLMLSAGRAYFVVLTAGTAVANGAYELSYADANSYDTSEGWVGPSLPPFGQGGVSTSSYGALPTAHWDVISSDYGQLAINATAIPEPGVLGLFGLFGLGFLWHRRKAKAV
jgi:hypothetical protein